MSDILSNTISKNILKPHGLEQYVELFSRYQLPAIGFTTRTGVNPVPLGVSKFGGDAHLNTKVEWPHNGSRPLDFLLQVNLAEATPFESDDLLPRNGLLSFFYDLENQPWGFDPEDLNGFRVLYSPTLDHLVPRTAPSEEFSLSELALNFRSIKTLPYSGSRAYDRMEKEAQFSEEHWQTYWDLMADFEKQYYPGNDGKHRLLGHSANIQGDMQLEAQLVTNGIYCGDPTGYASPRAKELESGADEWLLLLQFDSDEQADVMWGDCGMLYYWIKKSDLQQCRFDKVWMSLQCC